MTISDWPVDERPREKLLQRGAANLSDAELLAIFLRTGIRGQSAVELARDLLTSFGGLRPLLAADTATLQKTRGLGTAKTAALQATLEIARRHWAATLQRETALSNPAATRHYLSAHLRDRSCEVFAALFLDNRHRVIVFRELFRGTIHGAQVHPREVAREALQHNAAAVIVAHNHPSGIAEPSAADRAITDRLKQALELLDVRLLDHVIVGDGEMVSMAERGWV